jgi:hypothetical protein
MVLPELILGGMAELPADVVNIIEDLADWARRYRGKLDYKEVEKFKADVINAPGRWLLERVTISAFRGECSNAGLCGADTDKLVDLLRKAQEGKRQVVPRIVVRAPAWGRAPTQPPSAPNGAR